MSFLNLLIIHIFNLRMLLLMVAVWLLLQWPLPTWLTEMQQVLQTQVFRAGLLVSKLPQPRTSITVIHVPDAEYDRWQMDLSGADTLEKLLARGDSSALFGLIFEHPLVLSTPSAEHLLKQVQQGRRPRDAYFQEAKALLERKESLIAAFKSPRVVLGLTDPAVIRRHQGLTQESAFLSPHIFRHSLWPWPTVSYDLAISPVLQYFPIESHAGSEHRVATLTRKKVAPMFSLQYWTQSQTRDLVAAFLAQTSLPQTEVPQAPEPPAASPPLFATASSVDHSKVDQASASFVPSDVLSSVEAVVESNAPAQPRLSWQAQGFVLGKERIPTSIGAEIVPIYGTLSGIYASMKQITLSAALSGSELSGWVLVGRDGSAILTETGQNLASLGDKAFLYEPEWWQHAHHVLMILVVVFTLIVLPKVSWSWIVGGVSGLAVIIVSCQFIGQVALGFWLPGGDILMFLLCASLVMMLWRAQLETWEGMGRALDDACMQLAEQALSENRFYEANQHLQQCSTQEKVLDCAYRIAIKAEEEGELEQALTIFQGIKRRRRRYRDVQQRIRRLKVCVAYQQESQLLQSKEEDPAKEDQASIERMT